VIGRKNWLFSSSSKGAKASATIYSLIEIAKENDLQVFHYLVHLFETLPNINISDPGQPEKLVPWSEAIPERCYLPKE
jgi:transposase